MSRKIVFSSDTGGSGTVKSGFTVPSENKDVRVVAEGLQKAPLKRKFFKDMARETKANSRPVRKIKLNRSIFNPGFQGKPSFRVKTLDEIKSEKQQAKESTRTTAEPNVNDPATVQTIVANNSVDTRKVLKLNSVKKLMLPTIRLTRVSSGKYSRSITKIAAPENGRRIIESEAALRRFKQNEVPSRETDSQPLVMSPIKKRKMSPPESGPQTNRRSVDTSWSIDVDSSVGPDRPPSPPLSLGAQSDDELSIDPEPDTTPDSRVVINSAGEPKENCNEFKTVSMQPNFQCPTSELNSSLVNGDDDKLDVMSIMADDDELFLDDKPRPTLKHSLSEDSVFNLDERKDKHGDLRNFLLLPKEVGSNMKQPVGDLNSSRHMSKAYKIPHINKKMGTMPPDNFVNNFVATRNHHNVNFHHESSRNIRSESTKRHTTGNVPSTTALKGNTVEKVLPPREGQVWEGHSRAKGSCSQEFHGDHYQESRVKPLGDGNGLPMQEQTGLLNQVKVTLEQGNVGQAWKWIKKVDQMKSGTDVRLLEQLLKTCEEISCSNASPDVGDIALSAFELLKRCQGEAKPTDFILVILCLCRCQRIQEAFDRYHIMKVSKKVPQEDVLECFIDDLCKCLVYIPGKIIEVLQDIKMFTLPPGRKLSIVNKCIVSLISSPPKKLREVDAELWNTLLTMLCSPPLRNVQSALQVHNLMEQSKVELSPSVTVPLLKVFQESNSVRALLKLLTSKTCEEVLAKHKPPIDVGGILLSSTVKLQSVEECFSDLLKEGMMPSEDFLHHFIKKASLTKDYNVIYRFFSKCKRSSLSLPLSALKEMLDVLENWDENPDASVEVYTTLRQAKKDRKQPSASAAVRKEDPPKNSDRYVNSGFQKNRCFNFMRTGKCWRGDNCKFAHTSQQSSCHESGHSERGSVGKSQSPKDSDKSVEKPAPMVSQKASSDSRLHTSGSVNSRLANGIEPNTPRIQSPFSPFQYFGSNVLQSRPLFNQCPFNLSLFNQLHNNNPKFQHQFQRNPGHRIHIQPQGQGKQAPRGLGKQPRYGQGKQPPYTHEKRPPHEISLNTPRAQMVQSPAPTFHSSIPKTDKKQLGRSFSWEPTSKFKPNTDNHWAIHPNSRINAGSDNNNNNSGKELPELQHRVEMAVKSKEWQTLYTCYTECKGSNSQPVKSKDLQIFRSGFVNNSSSNIGQNFSAFVEFLSKKNNSGRSSKSSQDVNEVFDQYDIDFIGAVGVSLMQKCQDLKQFEEGYEVLLTLHAHNISYFHSGRNFGAYTMDISPQNVALIAVKLCLGIHQYGGLGAMEVLRASDYALGNKGEHLSQQDEEYRIKVLSQLFLQLWNEDHIPESLEVIQNLNAGPDVIGPMYLKVLNHYVAQSAFDQSFAVVNEMQEKGMELNCPPCQSLYEKFLRHCVTAHKYDHAAETLDDIESKGISMNGEGLQSVLNMLSSAEQDTLAKPLFEKCSDLGIYPTTFCNDTPWLCELGCSYSQVELRLFIQKHLEQIHNHLLFTRTSDQLVTAVKDFQIVLFPRLSAVTSGVKFSDGIQKSLAHCAEVVVRILQQDFNPPLTILEQSGEQFHKKLIVERMSVYRWFNANGHGLEQLVDGQEEYETSSQGSIRSDISELSN